MAKLISELAFTGSLGDFSAYKMRGVEGIIVRKKGGASKQKIRSSPAFADTRRVNAEFGGRATASKWIMKGLVQQKALADYNIAGPLNAMMKPIQQLDIINERGKRSIELSKQPHLLEGFSLTKKLPLESVIRASMPCTISRSDLTASIHIPELIPGINFHPQNYPMYSIVAVLGVIPDLFYDEFGYCPKMTEYLRFVNQQSVSEWHSTKARCEAITLSLRYPLTPPDDRFSLMLSIGIRYGTLAIGSAIEQVKYAGSAKIVAMG